MFGFLVFYLSVWIPGFEFMALDFWVLKLWVWIYGCELLDFDSRFGILVEDFLVWGFWVWISGFWISVIGEPGWLELEEPLGRSRGNLDG